MDVFETVKKTIVDTISCDPKDVTLEANIKDLGADSIDAVQIIMDLEEVYGIEKIGLALAVITNKAVELVGKDKFSRFYVSIVQYGYRTEYHSYSLSSRMFIISIADLAIGVPGPKIAATPAL